MYLKRWCIVGSEPNKAIAECPLQSNGYRCPVGEFAKRLQAG